MSAKVSSLNFELEKLLLFKHFSFISKKSIFPTEIRELEKNEY